jgi:hypothetical protein
VTVWSAGQEIVGAGVSTTVTVKLQLGADGAVEVTFTVVTPTGNSEPELGEAEIDPQSPSILMAEAKLTIAPLGLVAVATMFSGQVKEQFCPVGVVTTVAVSVVVLLAVF